jgi:hypothetical protein
MAILDRIPVDKHKLEVAARSAIRTWAGKEGTMSRQLRAGEAITEAFLQRWLGHWMLARSNPVSLRAALATELQTTVRPALIEATEDRLPQLVCDLADLLRQGNATRGLQTSLVSKFAFSLRPEVIVPYDRRARLGLRRMLGSRLSDHDYPAYLDAFNQFADYVVLMMEGEGITAAIRPEREPIMTEALFRLRAADKYFMLLGGFPVGRMERD